MTWSVGTLQDAQGNAGAEAALGGNSGGGGGGYPPTGDPIPGATQVPGDFTSLENANNSLNSWAAGQPASTQQAVQAFDSAFGPNGSQNDHGLPYALEGDTNSGWGSSLSGRSRRNGPGGSAGSGQGGSGGGVYVSPMQGDSSGYFTPQPGGFNMPTPPLNGFGNSGEAAGMMRKGGAVSAMADGGVVPDNGGDNNGNSGGYAGEGDQFPGGITGDIFSNMQDVLGYTQQQFGLGAQNQQPGGFAANANQMRPSTNVEDDRQGQIYPDLVDKVGAQGVMNAERNLGSLSGNGTTAPVAPNEGGDMGPAAPTLPGLPPGMARGGSVRAQHFDGGGGVLPTEQQTADPIGAQFMQAAQAAQAPTTVAMQNPEDYRTNMQEPANQKNEAGFSPGAVAEAQNSARGGPIQALDAGGGVLPTGNPQPRRPNPAVVKKLTAYLSGAGAAPQEHLEQAKQAVDPQGKMPGSMRTAHAITSQPTMPAKAATLQAARQRYNAYRHGAAAALNSGNVAAAAQMATHAHGNVPNGVNVTFTPKQQGAPNGPGR